MTFSKLCVTFSNTACVSSHVSNNKRVGKTCYQKITYLYRVSNMDRVEFKELHITTV